MKSTIIFVDCLILKTKERGDKLFHNIVNLIEQFYIPKITILDILEILIITTFIYLTIKYMKNTRAWIVVKGIFFLGIFYGIAYILSLNAILMIFESFTLVLSIALVTIFQPEIRKFLENIGSKKYKITALVKKKKGIEQKISDDTINELTSAAYALSKTKTGALIVIENSIPLGDYISTGIKINSNISSQLLINIFEKNTPLHDGAVIIRNNEIASATCYLPLSDNKTINKKLGTRHRAAIGTTELTDAIVIIVSEETGAVSIAQYGKIKHNIKEEKFTNELKRFQEETTEIRLPDAKNTLFHNTGMKVFSLILSFIIWVAMINVSNPIVSKTFLDVPITIVNDDAITSIEKTYSIKTDETTNIVITGNRKAIENLKKEDIVISADFTKLSAVYSIPLTATVNGVPDAKTHIYDDVMIIALEDMMETEFDIQIEQIGKPNNDCYIYDIVPEMSVISVKAGQSIINIIDKVILEIDVNNLNADKTVKIVPKVYDRNGTQINPEKIILSTKEIGANIQTYRIKTIPLNITLAPQDKFSESLISTHTYDINEVRISASDELLETIDEISISVPVTINDAQALNELFVKNIKIIDYMEDNNIYLPDISQNVNIAIELKETAEKAIKIPTTKIEVINLFNTHNCSFSTEEIEIIISGNKEDVINFDTNELKAYIDMKGYYSGTKTVPVIFNTAQNIIIDEISTKVIVSRKEE